MFISDQVQLRLLDSCTIITELLFIEIARFVTHHFRFQITLSNFVGTVAAHIETDLKRGIELLYLEWKKILQNAFIFEIKIFPYHFRADEADHRIRGNFAASNTRTTEVSAIFCCFQATHSLFLLLVMFIGKDKARSICHILLKKDFKKRNILHSPCKYIIVRLG